METIDIFKQSIINRVFSPESKLEAALDASNGTIRFVDEYERFVTSQGLYIFEIYRKPLEKDGLGVIYTDADGRLKVGTLDIIEDTDTYNRLADYAVKVALRLDHMTLNDIRHPEPYNIINDAFACCISGKMNIFNLLSHYYSVDDIIQFVESSEFKKLIEDCKNEQEQPTENR